MSVIDRSLTTRSITSPNSFPDFRQASTLFAFSDYGGFHNDSRFECFSYLYLSDISFSTWERSRLSFRISKHIRGRTFAFKKLGDSRKSRCLHQFLELAGNIDGLCASVLIDKRLQNLFDDDGRSDYHEVSASWPKARYKKSVFDRLLRVTHLNCFLLAGLIQPFQSLIWITDQDSIAANEEQLRALSDVFAAGLCRYLVQQDSTLPFNLGHIRCGTTASDNGTLQLEDLVSIPDLVAGALAESWTAYSNMGVRLRKGIELPPPSRLSTKARSIMGWLTEDTPLRQLIVAIEPGMSGAKYCVSIVDLVGTPGLYVPR